MESRFGHDFGLVRVHTDERASESARALNALGYTAGRHVVFAAGRYAPETSPGRRLLAHELAHVVQQRRVDTSSAQAKLEVGSIDDPLEREAERRAEEIADEVRQTTGAAMPVSLPPAPGLAKARVQRVPDPSQSPEPVPASPAPAGLIVDDEAAPASPEQMRKSEFLEGLKKHVCAVADSALAAAGRTAQGCPLIERWIERLRGRDAAFVERAIRKYAPEAAGAAAARDYYAAVGERVRQGVARWVATGEVSGVPPELMSQMGGGGIASLLGGIAAGVGAALGSIAGGLRAAASGIGGLFTKARVGGPRPADPAAVRASLGTGSPLDGGVKARMEKAFGHSFSSVRVHADSRASQLADSLNARAFTIGTDVAFATGEYRPGTLIGDALIAHELAHVLQQQSDALPAAPIARDAAADRSLEEDADFSALGAVASLWSGLRIWREEFGTSFRPRLRSGLALQRCGGGAAVRQQPNLATDPDLKKRWDAALLDGLALLNASFSKKGTEKGCKFPGSKPAQDWAFDKSSWTQVTAGEEIRKYGVAYVPQKQPHVSVDDLFNNLDRWECDCALFGELSWLYAWRHTLSDQEFDQRFSNLRLRPQETTGLERETHKAENIELGLEGGNFEKLWRDAPVGTKVVWKNTSAVARSPWEFENAIKSVKGATEDADRYDAHPIGANKSEAQVKRGLAENAADFPGNTFMVTASTIQQLRAAGAPEPFLIGLESLKGQTFIGKPAFTEALKQPAQALVQMRQQDPDRYTDLLRKLFDFTHAPATEDDKNSYVNKYIIRWEIDVPR
jgi:hypothetical protein